MPTQVNSKNLLGDAGMARLAMEEGGGIYFSET